MARPAAPLDAAAAKALATGYRVVLTTDGEPRTVTFEGFARPGTPAGTPDVWRHRLCFPIRLLG